MTVMDSEAEALRGALDNESPLEVLGAADKLTRLAPCLNDRQEGPRVVMGCAYVMGIAEGKRQDRARRKRARR